MHDDVGAVLERPDEVGRRHRVVDDQRHAGLLGDRRRCARDVDDDAAGIGDGFDEDRLGLVGVTAASKVGEIVRIGPDHAPAEVLVAVVELVDRAAIELLGGDELVARLQQRVEAQELGRVAGGDGERRRAALQRRDALLQHRVGRVADAGVDVAEGLQPEQRGGMVDVVEHEGRRLVDRRRPRARRRDPAARRHGWRGCRSRGRRFGHGGVSLMDSFDMRTFVLI